MPKIHVQEGSGRGWLGTGNVKPEPPIIPPEGTSPSARDGVEQEAKEKPSAGQRPLHLQAWSGFVFSGALSTWSGFVFSLRGRGLEGGD